MTNEELKEHMEELEDEIKYLKALLVETAKLGHKCTRLHDWYNENVGDHH